LITISILVMFMQYLVVALTCLSSNLQAARLRPKAGFVPALRLHHGVAEHGPVVGRAYEQGMTPEMLEILGPEEPLDVGKEDDRMNCFRTLTNLTKWGSQNL